MLKFIISAENTTKNAAGDGASGSGEYGKEVVMSDSHKTGPDIMALFYSIEPKLY